MALPTRLNERWSLDFVSDQLANGRRFRVLNIVDDYSRACVDQLVDTSIFGERLTRFLDELNLTRPLPNMIVPGNGPELTSKAIFLWSRQHRVKLHGIQPGKPTQNALVESFNGRYKDLCLNQDYFSSLDDARSIIDRWRDHYNRVRPHSSLGYRPPVLFEEQLAQRCGIVSNNADKMQGKGQQAFHKLRELICASSLCLLKQMHQDPSEYEYFRYIFLTLRGKCQGDRVKTF
jgi:putative transposase